ncbi:hypothetical protein GQ53DRAFT_767748 [Thozetella sp. PMI_491]|nr:hypothetical protein GQ53DRAFT_767748 [Thozetella sp. PMI_491]
MDVAYNAHASRRKNRSTTNLNHLSLAPLTSKLPLGDPDELPDALSGPIRSTSYLQGKSAPTTPRLLSRSPAPSRSGSRARGSSTPRSSLPKSKSATQLASNGRRTTGNVSPSSSRRRRDDAVLGRDSSDTDWLLRAGALISTETREYKGQSWLVSRESSTSLAGMKDPEEEAIDQELARAREMASRNASRRGSLAAVFDENGSSPPHSRYGSRSQVITPAERRSMDGYFPPSGGAGESDYIAGPDFVNLDEKLERLELEDTSMEDEAHVRRLVKRGQVSSWFGNVWGLQLLSVEETENEEESDGEVEEAVEERRRSSTRHFEGVTTLVEERMPPPKADEGGWQDAAWLLSVASKVLL